MSRPIGEDDLHSYIDDQLDLDRRLEVESYLSANPGLRQQIAAYRADTCALRTEATDRLSSPIPLRLRLGEVRRASVPAQSNRLKSLAAGIVVFACGAAAGSIFLAPAPQLGTRPPMADAMSAYRVFATSADNAVEIEGTKALSLVNRISGHLGRNIEIPDLSGLGLALLGGRLLASDEGPGGMFIYAEPNGGRIAVYVKTLADGRRSAFGSRQDGDVTAYYWFDGLLGYAIAGPANSTLVSRAADLVRATYR